jgi:hypothetical protein
MEWKVTRPLYYRGGLMFPHEILHDLNQRLVALERSASTAPVKVENPADAPVYQAIADGYQKDRDAERKDFEAWFATCKEHAHAWSPRYAAIEAWKARAKLDEALK